MIGRFKLNAKVFIPETLLQEPKRILHYVPGAPLPNIIAFLAVIGRGSEGDKEVVMERIAVK